MIVIEPIFMKPMLIHNFS